VTPYSVAAGYQRFGGAWSLHLQGDEGTFILINVDILPQHYTASQTPLLCKSEHFNAINGTGDYK